MCCSSTEPNSQELRKPWIGMPPWYIQSRYMSVAPSKAPMVTRWGGRVRAAFHWLQQ